MFQYHYRYQFKCRSDNAPHIFSVADAAYQDMLHHEQPQHILLAGETKSGKSLNYGKLIEHLLFLGEVSNFRIDLSYFQRIYNFLCSVNVFNIRRRYGGGRSRTTGYTANVPGVAHSGE